MTNPEAQAIGASLLKRRREPEARIPWHVLASKALCSLSTTSPAAQTVLFVIWAHVGRGKHRGRAWVSERRIARLTGQWRRTVERAIELLVSAGWLRVVKDGARARRTDRWGRQVAREYELLLPGDAGEADEQVKQDLLIDFGSEDWIIRGSKAPYVRCAIVPLSVLSSKLWAAIPDGVGHRSILAIDALTSGGRAPEALRHPKFAKILGCTEGYLRACLKLGAAFVTKEVNSGRPNIYGTRFPTGSLTPVECPDPSCKLGDATDAEPVDVAEPENPPPLPGPAEAGPRQDPAQCPEPGRGVGTPTGPPVSDGVGSGEILDKATFWVEFCGVLEGLIGDRDMDAWVRPGLDVALVGPDRVEFAVTSRWHRDWFEENMTTEFAHACAIVLGGKPSIVLLPSADMVCEQAVPVPISADDLMRTAVEQFSQSRRRAGARTKAWRSCSAKELDFLRRMASTFDQLLPEAVACVLKEIPRRDLRRAGTVTFLERRLVDIALASGITVK